MDEERPGCGAVEGGGREEGVALQVGDRLGLDLSAELRLLRQSRLVTVRRSGRHAHYRLHDHHVVDLLAALRHHHEHINPPAPPSGMPASAADDALTTSD